MYMYCRTGTGTDGRFYIIHVTEPSFSLTAFWFVIGRHGRHFEIITSNQKSDPVSRCVGLFTRENFFSPNFIPIGFEKTEPKSPVHTGALATSRRKWRQFVADFGDYSRQCGQGFRLFLVEVDPTRTKTTRTR